MAYVDGYVVPVPAANRTAYLDVAAAAAVPFHEYGATRVVECWGDDVPAGQVTDLRRAVALDDGEVVVFSWIEWPSRAVRDAAHERMRADARMEELELPFVGGRMIFGGFDVLLDALGGGSVDRVREDGG